MSPCNKRTQALFATLLAALVTASPAGARTVIGPGARGNPADFQAGTGTPVVGTTTTPTATPPGLATPLPTTPATPAATATATPTLTAVPTATATPSATPAATGLPTAIPTAIPTATPPGTGAGGAGSILSTLQGVLGGGGGGGGLLSSLTGLLGGGGGGGGGLLSSLTGLLGGGGGGGGLLSTLTGMFQNVLPAGTAPPTSSPPSIGSGVQPYQATSGSLPYLVPPGDAGQGFGRLPSAGAEGLTGEDGR